jgi:hypothetical protein
MTIRDDSIEDLTEVIREAYHDTLDVDGPSFKVMATKVFDDLFTPAPTINERAMEVRQAAARYLEAAGRVDASPRLPDDDPRWARYHEADRHFTGTIGFGFAADAEEVAKLIVECFEQPEDLVLANQVLVAVPAYEGDAVTITVSGRIHDLWKRAAGVEE